MHGFGGPRHLMSQEVSKPADVGGTLRRLAGQFRRYWPLLLLVAALMVAGSAPNQQVFAEACCTPAGMGRLNCFTEPGVR